ETEMVPLPYSADYFAISPHGIANTHLDALCHVFNQGKMYNGYSASDVTSEGARNGAIDALKDGIVSRGVLIDVPRVKGREWLEPGEAISPADLEAAEQAGGFRVEEGDVLLVRTGRHALEALAEACTTRSRWTFMLAVAPLVLERGTASPVNPLAMF